MAINDKSLAKACAMRSEKLGAWFEHELQAVFAEFREHLPSTFLRLYDTKSAGSYLPSQPGDFILNTPVDAFLIESKASAKYESLSSCLSSNVSKEQAVEHIMWRRSGHRSVFIFLSTKTGLCSIWDGKYVGEHRRRGDRMKDADGILYFFDARIDFKWHLQHFFFQEMK